MEKISLKLNRLGRRMSAKVFKLWYHLKERPLHPPTPWEDEMIEELRSTLRALPDTQQESDSEISQAWFQFQKALIRDIAEQDPRSFLRWPVILDTMFPENPEYVPIELAALKADAEWLNRWKHAINETPIGRPLPCWMYQESSANVIHQAFHLLTFEREWGIKINYFDQILEFGGGYGSLRRVIHELGYHGKYCIHDFPSFLALQRFYFLQLGLSVEDCNSGTLLLSSTDHFLDVCQASSGRTLFIANWSLSEAPLELRTRVLSEVVKHCTAFLIGYQDEMCNTDNASYFSNWSASIAKNFDCRVKLIEHLSGNSYLMGWKIAI